MSQKHLFYLKGTGIWGHRYQCWWWKNKSFSTIFSYYKENAARMWSWNCSDQTATWQTSSWRCVPLCTHIVICFQQWTLLCLSICRGRWMPSLCSCRRPTNWFRPPPVNKGQSSPVKVKRSCFHRMTTGLDCRMTSLFLNTTRRRGEQSNTQNTVAYIVGRQDCRGATISAFPLCFQL